MSNSDIASALDRYAPGNVGSCIKFTFTNAASAVQTLTFHSTAPVGGFAVNQPPVYISIKVTVACHVCFGDANVGAPTNADTLFEPSDSWQDMILPASATSFRVKGDSAGGDIYIWPSGKP
jgi:hypothetical protein